jgi:hypothetical protein
MSTLNDPDHWRIRAEGLLTGRQTEVNEKPSKQAMGTQAEQWAQPAWQILRIKRPGCEGSGDGFQYRGKIAAARS